MNKIPLPLKIVLIVIMVFGIQTIISNGYLGLRNDINYFGITSGMLCIILSVAALSGKRWVYYGLIANLLAMAIVLPMMAQKVGAANLIVVAVVVFRDPVAWVIIVLLCAFVLITKRTLGKRTGGVDSG